MLLIGRDSDLHLDVVLLALERRRIRVVRVDPERITPENTSLSWRDGRACIHTYDGDIDPHALDGVFCRYAIEAMRTDSRDAIERFAFDEFWSTLRAILLHVPSEKWINDPFREAAADHKPLQLSIARLAGLPVPPTVITQNSTELKDFAQQYSFCAIKPLSDTGLARAGQSFVNEIDPSSMSGASGSFTARFDPALLQSGFADLSCPVMLQAEIRKEFDIRATVIDDAVFAAKLVPIGKQVAIDIRNNDQVDVARFDLGAYAAPLVAIVRELGLRFASCDLIADADELYFLEANPSGNWLWTEQGADLPISEAIADALVRAIRDA